MKGKPIGATQLHLNPVNEIITQMRTFHKIPAKPLYFNEIYCFIFQAALSHLCFFGERSSTPPIESMEHYKQPENHVKEVLVAIPIKAKP